VGSSPIRGAKFMQCYGVRKGAITAYSNWEMIWTDVWNGSENDTCFGEKEIIAEDVDGLLKVLKCFYPNDRKHFMFVNRKDLICL
jgi:hypothetical protein